ncbi:MAG: DUF3093 domain-containing protein, partial [Pseudonocardiales bacterium]|nr:DUF3093 domain-containing protein [Pseudonocardiales bacterium]
MRALGWALVRRPNTAQHSPFGSGAVSVGVPGHRHLRSRVDSTSRRNISAGHTSGETTLGPVPDRQAPDDRRPPDAKPAFDEHPPVFEERLPVFEERLTVPLWWWPLGFGVATLLAAEVHMGYPGVRSWLPYLLIVPLTSVVLMRMGRHRVTLRGGELRVGSAHVPIRYLGRVQVIYPNAKRRALGPDLDPAAFVLHTGWVGPVLRITLTDPADPTPYWIFS